MLCISLRASVYYKSLQGLTGSNPHQLEMKSAIVPVTRWSDARLTRSSKAWMSWETGPYTRHGHSSYSTNTRPSR